LISHADLANPADFFEHLIAPRSSGIILASRLPLFNCVIDEVASLVEVIAQRLQSEAAQRIINCQLSIMNYEL